MRRLCGVKVVDKVLTRDLMQMLDMNETIDLLTRANSVRWYGHVLRKHKNNLLRMGLNPKVKWTMKSGRPKKIWLIAVVEQSRNVGLKICDTNDRLRWRLGINTISIKMR